MTSSPLPDPKIYLLDRLPGESMIEHVLRSAGLTWSTTNDQPGRVRLGMAGPIDPATAVDVPIDDENSA